MMKRKFVWIVCALAVLLLCSAIPNKAQAATYGSLTYTVSNDEVTITYCDTSVSGALTIPETIDGLPVTCIGTEAFFYCTGLTAVTIPEGVVTIDDLAFAACSSLTDVTIPDSVTSVGDETFAECGSLRNVIVGDGVQELGSTCFGYCSNLTTITLPGGLTAIGSSAFAGCESLTDVYFGGTEKQAAAIEISIYGNELLTNAMWHYTEADTSGTCGDSVTWSLETDGTLIVLGTGEMDDYSGTDMPWIDHQTSIKKVVIESGVTRIGSCAFYYCTGLTAVTIPEGIITIDDLAFAACSSLTDVTIPDSVTSVGDETFAECGSLRNVIVGDGVQELGSTCFGYCSNLTTITLPGGLTAIGSSAFAGCKSLSSVTYCGTEAQWDAININIGNDYLMSTARSYHIFAAATCMNPKTCTICGETDGEVLGHIIGADGCTFCGDFAGYYWVLSADATVEMSLTQDLYVDLNGFDLNGIITTNGYKVYGMDSTTDGYTCDEMGYFSCVDAEGNAIVPESHFKGSTETIGSVKRYMTVHTENGYTFHRFYLGVTHASIKPGASGVGYKAVFAGDEMVQTTIESYGCSLQLDGFEPVNAEKAGSPVSGKAFTVRINGFDVDTYGETPLTAQVYITVNGETISASAYTTTLKAMVQAVDADASKYTATQLAALKAWLGEYTLPKSWDLTNI